MVRFLNLFLAMSLVGCGERHDQPLGKQEGDAGPDVEPSVKLPTTPEEKGKLLSQLKSGFLDEPLVEYLFDCKPGDLPFSERPGKRGRIVTFGSQFGKDHSQDLGLAMDVQVLSQLKEAECYAGAGTFAVQPFLCELPVKHWPLTGEDVLTAVKAREFRSAHIKTLKAARIPYPGYHPRTLNDEIHNTFAKQYIFETEDQGSESKGNHGILKRHVHQGQLWYVLLHTGPRGRSPTVILFAVGSSADGQRLVGVVTQQVCHNLCD